MARANLRGLIGNLGDTEPTTPRAETPAVSPVDEAPDLSPESASGRTERAMTPPLIAPQGAPSAPERTPPVRQSESHFSSFQRKETRLRADQQNALTEHARRLNRAKGTGGSRITDNTLIRVAVDLLLSKTEKLAGRTESDLRRSVGLKGGQE